MKVKKYIFPKSAPRPFCESLGPDIPVCALISFDISSVCHGNIPTKSKIYLEVCNTQGLIGRRRRNAEEGGRRRSLTFFALRAKKRENDPIFTRNLAIFGYNLSVFHVKFSFLGSSLNAAVVFNAKRRSMSDF